nr:hypothetical protein [uncultured Carboxylicivirga sp.]
MEYLMSFDFNKITVDNAWLLGFIYADSTIGNHLGKRIVRLFHKNQNLLENVKEHYSIPYKIGSQVNGKSKVYFIRFADQDFVGSLEQLGFFENKSQLTVPEMSIQAEKNFIKGFFTGKGSYFKEKESNVSGLKIIYRSKTLINDISNLLSKHCDVSPKEPFCNFIKNEYSCQIKYVGEEYTKIKDFLNHKFKFKANNPTYWY